MKAHIGPKRSLSNDGTPNHTENYLPINQRDLARLLAIFTSEPRAPHIPRIFHGPKAAHAGHPPCILSDEQVLTVRKMRQWHGMKPREIIAATGLSEGTVRTILRYCNRVHLDPGPAPVEV